MIWETGGLRPPPPRRGPRTPPQGGGVGGGRKGNFFCLWSSRGEIYLTKGRLYVRQKQNNVGQGPTGLKIQIGYGSVYFCI